MKGSDYTADGDRKSALPSTVRELRGDKARLAAALRAAEREQHHLRLSIAEIKRECAGLREERDAAVNALRTREAAINWALGCNGEFERPPTAARGTFWWRAELAERARMRFNNWLGKYVALRST